MPNEALTKLLDYTAVYQKRTTHYRRPDQVLEALDKLGVHKMDLTPFEFQCVVGFLLTNSTGKDVGLRPEALTLALRDALKGESNGEDETQA